MMILEELMLSFVLLTTVSLHQLGVQLQIEKRRDLLECLLYIIYKESIVIIKSGEPSQTGYQNDLPILCVSLCV